MTEQQLQTAVISCARYLGWTVAHFRAAKTGKGWRTPVEADGAGFPDLVLVHRKQPFLIFAELKGTGGSIRPAQQEWMVALMRVADAVEQAVSDSRLRGYAFDRAPVVQAHVWKPVDWTSGRIEEALRVPAD